MHTISRMCITCCTRQSPDKMIRIVRIKDQVIFVFPEDESLQGRSAYLCKKSACILKALDRKGKDAVSYALKVSLPPTVKTALRDFATKLSHATA